MSRGPRPCVEKAVEHLPELGRRPGVTLRRLLTVSQLGTRVAVVISSLSHDHSGRMQWNTLVGMLAIPSEASLSGVSEA